MKGLNDVVAHDWKSFLERRLLAKEEKAPLDGIARGGWKVTIKKEPNELRKTIAEDGKLLNLTSSIGLLLSNEGKVTDVVPGSPADKAGIGPHMKVLAVNGRRFDNVRMAEAITATEDGKAKLDFVVENGDFITIRLIDYAGGAKHPHLQRDEAKPDLIGAIFKPRTAAAAPVRPDPCP